ncbi:SRPBCC family protein [Kitasatospora sp. NPDC059648]|uniref:SRPBCC family protein n=1 Tax=Kitasatospora sp. NPDC059648 TaxID=3346894 RepID=UPI0036AD29A4
MARFVLTRRSPLPPAECWARLTAWPRHGDRVPFTRVSVARGTGRRPGDVVLARTALGPLRFDDPMELVEVAEPAHCQLVKRGRVVRGGAELRVRAAGSGSEVVWAEELRIAGLPRLLDPAVGFVGRLVFGRVLDHLLATAAGPAPG